MFDSGRSYFLGRSHIRLAPKNACIIFRELINTKCLNHCLESNTQRNTIATRLFCSKNYSNYASVMKCSHYIFK